MRDAHFRASSDDLDWEHLLDHARSGDATAINRVWSHMRSYLLLVAERGMGDGLSAKIDPSDIVQGSLLEAQRDFDRFTGNSETELKAWLRRLVKHNLVDSRRHFQSAQSRDIRLERRLSGGASDEIVDPQQATASSMVRREETDLELIQAVSQLQEDQRRLIEMRHRHGMTYEAIGQELGISERAVRNRWSIAIAQLRKELCNGGRSPL
ncbi:sigma-70 family RNA polymerase sigma factor [Blastopirellula sp. J2-11]|uniref:sigma-70 family RNA polymerase sigma factor n=1 Tax=Blastopirellula sp. J2-11 TaxID=2943192 RepID=UPI0021C6FB04|nr:sigma-70 family RNA polymerase sigma factor [Blastopirellula sp. J2-11]UUO07462.1 sigma-70 family RNA polymerase sigma factor [Blastopirellula sp. J2-11]